MAEPDELYPGVNRRLVLSSALFHEN